MIKGSVLSIVAAALTASAAAFAATPDQAARGRACGLSEDVVQASIAKRDVIASLAADVEAARRGDGDFVLFEFSDYSCPSCRAFNPVLAAFAERDPGVSVAHVEAPIYGRTFVSRITGNKTLDGSRVGLAVARTAPEAYVTFHDFLMNEPGRVSDDKIERAVVEAGLDWRAVRDLSESDDVKEQVDRHLEIFEAMDVRGVPMLIADGLIIRGAGKLKAVACLKNARSATATGSAGSGRSNGR